MAKSKWRKIITAGPLVLEAEYPAVVGRDQKTRAGKRKLSSEAQQRMNQKYSYQKLELMLAANLTPGDLVVTLTYDDAHLPKSRKEAEAKLKYFRAKLASARRKRGAPPLVMVWCTEHKHDEGRWHHHVAMNATGEDFTEIRKLWGQGTDVEIQRLRVDKEKNYLTLARYMCKETKDKLGLRSWSYTRTAKHPEVDTFRVEADVPLSVPRGAVQLENVSVRTEYGHYKYIKYMWPAGAKQTKKTAAKRRRRRP